MCGRFALKAPPADIARQFGVDAVPELAPRYNIAPTQDILVIRHPWREPEARLLGITQPRRRAGDSTAAAC